MQANPSTQSPTTQSSDEQDESIPHSDLSPIQESQAYSKLRQVARSHNASLSGSSVVEQQQSQPLSEPSKEIGLKDVDPNTTEQPNFRLDGNSKDSQHRGVASPFVQAGLGGVGIGEAQAQPTDETRLNQESQGQSVEADGIHVGSHSSASQYQSSPSMLQNQALVQASLTSLDPFVDLDSTSTSPPLVPSGKNNGPKSPKSVPNDQLKPGSSPQVPTSFPSSPLKKIGPTSQVQETKTSIEKDDGKTTSSPITSPSTKKRSSRDSEGRITRKQPPTQVEDEEEGSNVGQAVSMAITGISSSDRLIAVPNAKAKELYKGFVGLFGEKEKKKPDSNVQETVGGDKGNQQEQVVDPKKGGILGDVRKSLSIGGPKEEPKEVKARGENWKLDRGHSSTGAGVKAARDEKPLPPINQKSTQSQGVDSSLPQGADEKGGSQEGQKPKEKQGGFESGRRFGFITRKSDLPILSPESKEMEVKKSTPLSKVEGSTEAVGNSSNYGIEHSTQVSSSSPTPDTSSLTNNREPISSPPTSPTPTTSRKEKRFSFNGVRRRFSSQEGSSSHERRESSNHEQTATTPNPQLEGGYEPKLQENDRGVGEGGRSGNQANAQREAIMIPALSYGRQSGEALRKSLQAATDSQVHDLPSDGDVPPEDEHQEASPTSPPTSSSPTTGKQTSKPEARPDPQSKRSSFSEIKNKIKVGVEKFRTESGSEVVIGSANKSPEEKKKKVTDVRDLGLQGGQSRNISGDNSQAQQEQDPSQASASIPTVNAKEGAVKDHRKSQDSSKSSSPGLLTSWANSLKSLIGTESQPKQTQAPDPITEEPVEISSPQAQEALNNSSSVAGTSERGPQASEAMVDKGKKREKRKSWREVVNPSQWMKELEGKSGTEVKIGGKTEHGTEKAEIKKGGGGDEATTVWKDETWKVPIQDTSNSIQPLQDQKKDIPSNESLGRVPPSYSIEEVSPKSHPQQAIASTSNKDAHQSSGGQAQAIDSTEDDRSKKKVEKPQVKEQEDYFGSAVNRPSKVDGDEGKTKLKEIFK